MKYTPDQYSDLLDRFGKGLPTVIARGRLSAAQQLRRDIPGRIHRVGGTKDIDGNTRGYISIGHIIERKAKGLQTARVDHTFTGDLQRSYKLFETKRQIDLKIFGSSNVEKARSNEDLYKAGVWEASDSEETKALKAFNVEFSKYIKRFFS